MDVQFSIARPRDAEAISDLVVASVEAFIAPTVEAEGVRHLVAIASPEAIRARLAEGYRFHLAHAADGELVGIAATRDDQHLYFLYVEGAWHGSGLGRELWNIARAACEAAGHHGPYTVNASNNARGFYKRLGFVGGRREEKDGVVFWPMVLEP